MKQFTIIGMSCAACSARVESAVKKVDGVDKVAVNLLLGSMSVEGTASDDAIIKAVQNAGYGAFVAEKVALIDKKQNNETIAMRNKLLFSLGFLIVLMYVSMGHNMLSLPLPLFLSKNPFALAFTQMVLALIIIVINRKFYINGAKGLFKGAPNMDTLVALGSFAGFIYSFVNLVLIGIALSSNNIVLAKNYLHDLYFESSAMILVLITLGKMLEAYSKGKTTTALKSLMALAPKTATLIVDGKEKVVLIDQVKVGDIFVVRPGESIPVDATILEGHSAINESSITGESIPVDKGEGDDIKAGTINEFGFIKCVATFVGEDTSLSKIIKMVNDVSLTKAPISKIADKVSGIFVPIVMGIAFVTFVIWLIISNQVGYSLARGISVLVISCPCALGLATPIAIMVGSGISAKLGVLFKNAEALEQTGKANIIALDKTGTITLGKPVLTDIITFNDVDENALLSLAYSLEIKSEHPLAKAIVKKADELNLIANEVEDFRIYAGGGVCGKLNGKILCGGNYKFISEQASLDRDILNISDSLSMQGKTPIYFALDGKLIGIIAVEDEIKKDSAFAVKQLKELGLKVVMLTGDNKKTAHAIASKVGIDEIYHSLMPEDKSNIIKELKKQGKVIMVGDGINDALSLTTADIGVAIGQGTDVAIESADVVLMKNDLFSSVNAISLSKKVITNIKQNLFWAFFYNMICIPLAGGVFIPFGITLNPMIGAGAMSISSLFVVGNALRLNLFKAKHLSTNERIVKLKGMMCNHCEKRVESALKKLPFILSATADYKKGIVTITFDGEFDENKIKQTINSEHYKFIKIKENKND